MGRAKVRAVIFDLDDTLLDHSSALRLAVSDLYSVRPELITKFPSEEKFYRAWQEAQDKHYSAYLRGSLSHAEQKIFRIREVWQPIANLSEAECFQVYDHFQTLYESHWRIFPDVFPCLEALVPLKVGLISNGWAPQQKRKLLKENLYQIGRAHV